MKLALRVLAVLVLTWLPASAGAVMPEERLADPTLEARARELSSQLRCLVCQNQSIDESDAELAADLRVLVRERVAAGDSDGEVLGYISARYGEFVLLNPQVGGHTLLLWVAAPLLFAAGAAALIWLGRPRHRPEVELPSLSPEEAAVLDRLAADDGIGSKR